VHDYFPCEEPLQTNYFDFQPTWISTVNNPNAPLMSNYINESPVDIKIREEPLCEWAAKDLAVTAAGEATLFPNPASDRLSITLGDAEIMIVSVYDLNGSLIAEFRPGTVSATTVDISNLSAGAYLIDITDAEGTVRRDKFVKE
jgi:hypothetical protein